MCIEGKECIFAIGCFFFFCGAAGGSCLEAGKWCKATQANKNMQHQRHELKQCLHGHTHKNAYIYDAYQAASIN